MRPLPLVMLVTAVGAIATTACTTDPYTGQQTINRTAVGIGVGALSGYLLGDVIGGDHDRNAKVIGVGIGALAGCVTGTTLISTRRFSARPASVSFEAIGWLSP